MNGYERYAIYWAPDAGPLADFTACWLGWDAINGTTPPPLNAPSPAFDISQITETPRKYGFHGTIKPPFRLANGSNRGDLATAARTLCKNLPILTLPGLELRDLDGFLALTPTGDQTDLATLAAKVVADLDHFRAQPSPDEIARRRPEALTPAQRAHLNRWGYPYVMDQFRFHLTLTGHLPPDQGAVVHAALSPLITPLLPKPFRITSLCLFGQAQDGRFHLLERYALAG